MKFGIYKIPGHDNEIRCIDGEFTYINPVFYSVYAPGTRDRWDAILGLPGEAINDHDFSMLKFSGYLCSHSRSTAKMVYGVPDNIDLYVHGDFDIDITPKMLRTERINLRISPELKSKLQEAAEKEGRTVSNFIEHLIRDAIFNGDE